MPPPAAAAQAARGGEFGERISVVAVEIPVRVLVGGVPVAGLTAADFRVLEGGVERRIVGFEQVDLSRTPAEAGIPAVAAAGPGALAGDGRRLLLLFDTAYSSRKHLVRAADGARRLVEQGLHPADRVAVATYSGLRGLAFLTGFSADREATRLALDVVAAGVAGNRRAHAEAARALAGHGGLGAGASPLERFRSLSDQFGQAAATAFAAAAADLGVAAAALGGGAVVATGGPRPGAAPPPTDPVRAGLANLAPAQIAAGLEGGVGRSGIRALSLELIEMATVLRDLPGQKHLFLLSQGFPAGLLEDSTALFHLENALAALRRANWAIQAIDIEGVPEPYVSDLGAHSLFYLANETGGELIANHNDIAEAAGKLVERTAVSYVLTIQPTDVVADGRYRRLEVRLRDGAARRARVIHRPGYYAPKPWSRRSALENVVDAAALLLSQRRASELAVEILALPLPGSGLAEVPVVLELPAAGLGWAGPGGLCLEFHGYALDGERRIQDLFSRRLRLGRREARALLAGGGVRFYDRLALPPGDYELRLLVRDLDTGASFLGTVPLSIPGPADDSVVTGPLIVADDGWALLRGGGSLSGGRGGDHPFVLAGRPRIPSPRPVVAAGGRATFFVKLRLDAADLRISARILDPAGRGVEGGELAFEERVLGDGERVEALLGSLRAGGLEPGPYRLEIVASWDGGERRSVAVGEFRVLAE